MAAGDLSALLSPLSAAPERSALVFDFDGTLSAVVEDPASAVAAPGVAPALDALASRFRVVAVVSGRPVAFLAAHLPASVHLSGLYGLEASVGGERIDHPEAQRWRPLVAGATDELLRAAQPGGPLAGAVVEAKGLSTTVHVRTRPELSAAAEREAELIARRYDLEVRAAKMSVEVHPRVSADKGTVFDELVASCRRALFVGDDLGDLPAFAALAAARADGRLEAAVALAVGGPELPPAVQAAADAVLPGTDAVLELLTLLGRAGPGPGSS